jgi:hypothetical protein
MTSGNVYLKACWSKDDIEEGDIVKAQFDLENILEQAEDLFGSNKDLQYYDEDCEEWKALVDLKELEYFREGKMSIPIRVPALFDDTCDHKPGCGHDHDGLVKMRKLDSGGFGPMLKQKELKHTVERLVGNLKDARYERAPNDSVKDHTGVTTTTRDWVLAQAARDTELRTVLLSQPRALKHIVQCLHFDLLWNNEEKRYPNDAASNVQAILDA